MTGVAAWAIAGQITGAPLLFLGLLAWFVGGYFAVWLVAYALARFRQSRGHRPV